MQALQTLDKEFDVADAAARQFDVDASGAGLALALVNARAGFRNGFYGAEVSSRPGDQRLDKLQQLAAGVKIASCNAGFDQHLQFPVAAAGSVILLRAFQGLANFPKTAI